LQDSLHHVPCKATSAIPSAGTCAGTQLVRRNDELALLYEKIKIQQSALSKGQVQYRDRLNEIRVLKIKINDLKRELHILRNSIANIDVLKREVHSLGRQLLQERTKVKALSEELENPLNVHRRAFGVHCVWILPSDTGGPAGCICCRRPLLA
jgi:chromosome segregation ATPase